MNCPTLISGAMPEGDYQTEIARRMWCAVVEGIDDEAQAAELAELRTGDLAATKAETKRRGSW